MNFNPVNKKVQKLIDMIYAPMFTKILWAAIELNIFSATQRTKNYSQIAQELDLDENNARLFLDALAGMEFLEKKEDGYKNTEVTEEYLVRGEEQYVGDFLRIYGEASDFNEADIVGLVRKGPSAFKENEGIDVDKMFKELAEKMKGVQKGYREKEIVDIVSSLPEYGDFRKMLDLGGGAGLLSMAVLDRSPHLKAVIFETPTISPVIKEAVRERGMENRVEIMVGDYAKDSIGQGYDLIMAVGTLNFVKQDMEKVIKKIYDALHPGGIFLSISDGLTHDDTKPAEMVASWLPMRLKGYDVALRQSEVSRAALQAGFKSVYKQTLNLLEGPMDLDIARK